MDLLTPLNNRSGRLTRISLSNGDPSSTAKCRSIRPPGNPRFSANCAGENKERFDVFKRTSRLASFGLSTPAEAARAPFNEG